MQYAAFWLLIVWGQGGSGSALTSQSLPFPTIVACQQAKAALEKTDPGLQLRPTAEIAHIYCIAGQ